MPAHIPASIPGLFADAGDSIRRKFISKGEDSFVRLRRVLSLGALLGIGTATILPATASTQADYLMTRAKHEIVMPQVDQPLAAQFPELAGKVIEVQGTVTGITNNVASQVQTSSGYLLQLDSGQTVPVQSKSNDPDIAVGNRVHVLARVPTVGAVLEEITGTRSGGLLPETNAATLTPQFAQAIQPKAIAAQVQPSEPQAEKPKVAAVKVAAPVRAKAQISEKVAIYANRIQRVNGDIERPIAEKIAQRLLEKSSKYNVDPRLVFAVLAQESRFNPRAVSPVGARGLGQLMPATARSLGVRDAFDITQNLDGTVRYLRDMLDTYGGNTRLALAAYNAGPGNVRRYGGIPPFRETQNYVSRITAHYAQLGG